MSYDNFKICKVFRQVHPAGNFTLTEYYVDQVNEWRWGCKHYKRLCQLLTPCCNNIYTCQLCHDENENHAVDRKTIKQVSCSLCGHVQTSRWFCQKCHTRFAYHYCGICVIFDDDIRNATYHCDQCRSCRIGGRAFYIHCGKCNQCIGYRVIKTHICETDRDPAQPVKEPIIAYEA